MTEKTIVNCRRKSGLCSGPEENEEVEVVDPEILERLNLDQEAWEKWVAIDDSLETGPSGSVEEIVEEVKHQFREEKDDSEEEDDEEIDEPHFSNSEALAAIEGLNKFFIRKAVTLAKWPLHMVPNQQWKTFSGNKSLRNTE